uniref:40S ribosomal protein S4-like n=1 Tax=Podarcis muralis TaxID=64176 RepID=A0A670K8A1_PODMU|nr:40S ribosomal protein S4-like [Podarcis muralis]
MGPHKLHKCLPLVIFLRNWLKYALTGDEVKKICMQRFVKIDGKVRTDVTYPAGFMDVISIEKTGEHFRLVYDQGVLFTMHHISPEEAKVRIGGFESFSYRKTHPCWHLKMDNERKE